MDLTFTDEEQAFRAQIRAFLAAELPKDLAEKSKRGWHLAKDDVARWNGILHKQGWSAPAWPREYGGTGWTPVQRYIFDEECADAWAPHLSPFGLNMVGPVIYTFGSDDQKAAYLPAILSGETFWCQGYSEPGSGSDLASLKTRAVRDGDHYVVNGHKVWTTQAHWADMMFCLVRTDTEVKQQEGISFLLIDMHSPGIEVRPIITIDGGHSINEVFLDDVRVPAENLIGQEGKGWTYAKFLLGHERTLIAGVSSSKKRIAQLKKIAAAEQQNGVSLLDDQSFRNRIAEAEVSLMALEMTSLRSLASESAGRGPGPESSILKIRGSELQQTISSLLVEAVGYYAAPYELERFEDGWNEAPLGPDYAQGSVAMHLYGRASTIYGGSNEIQRNVIAKMILGL
jgi:alkylation response protein AidB-like acyl-CoA dehydrogenase